MHAQPSLLNSEEIYSLGCEHSWRPSEVKEHIKKCLNGLCSACGENIEGYFDLTVNHFIGKHGDNRCTKQALTVQHVVQAAQKLDGIVELGTNCFATAHFGRHASYQRNGVKEDCILREWQEKVAWLESHGIVLTPEMFPATPTGRKRAGL